MTNFYLCSEINWNPDNVRNGKIDTYCSSHNSTAMVFGQNSVNQVRETSYNNNSRSLLTQPISLCHPPHVALIEHCSSAVSVSSSVAPYQVLSSTVSMNAVNTSSIQLDTQHISSTVKILSTNSEMSTSYAIESSHLPMSSSITSSPSSTNYVAETSEVSPSPSITRHYTPITSTKLPDVSTSAVDSTVSVVTPSSNGLTDQEAILLVESEAVEQVGVSKLELLYKKVKLILLMFIR